MSRESIFKARVVYEHGKVRITPIANRRCIWNFKLGNALIHEAQVINHELDWCDTFVEFTYEGVTYTQIKSDPSLLCKGCVFSRENENGIHVRCAHPYFETKPHCAGRIYVVKECKLKKFNNPERAEELHLGIIQAGDNSLIKIDIKDIPKGVSVDEFLAQIKNEGITIVDA